MSVVSSQYYQDELRYLREAGPEFARAHPDIARLLADRGSDPDVERLLEGVAFLCGRIRQKLDDELPELTANLMGLLWPHYLRPVPSLSIMEMVPDGGAMQAPLPVKKGAEFASVPVDGTSCRYQSCWPMMLRPCVLEEAGLDLAPARPAALNIRLRAAGKATLEACGLSPLRLHLAGDPLTAFTLYWMLTAGVSDGQRMLPAVQEVRVSAAGSGGKPEVLLSSECVRAAGLDRAEAVLRYPARSFAGYRLLQEYFTLKERFLFVDILGLDHAVKTLGVKDAIQITVVFNRRLESYPRVTRNNVRLHCVPIINLFAQSADPVRLKHDQAQYLVMPSKTGVADRRHAEVFSVDAVAGLARVDGGAAVEYRPFYSFEHELWGEAQNAAYYLSHVAPAVEGGDDALMGTDTYVSLVGGAAEEGLPAEATISLELTCTNRHLPEKLRAGDICEATDSSPPGTRFANLNKPTATVRPPLGKALHWRLISHLALNHASLTDVEHFRELLRVYEFQAEHDAQRAHAHRRLLDGIRGVRTSFRERLIRGAVARGIYTEIDLHEDHFAGEGDAYLFATILDRFLGLYVTVNAFSELKITFMRTKQEYAFAPRWGEQLTPAGAREGARA